jgi:hypothetical protein
VHAPGLVGKGNANVAMAISRGDFTIGWSIKHLNFVGSSWRR